MIWFFCYLFFFLLNMDFCRLTLRGGLGLRGGGGRWRENDICGGE